MFLNILLSIFMSISLACGKKKSASAPPLGKYVNATVDSGDDFEEDFEGDEAYPDNEAFGSQNELEPDLPEILEPEPLDETDIVDPQIEEENDQPEILEEPLVLEVNTLSPAKEVFVEEVTAIKLRNGFTGDGLCLAIEGPVGDSTTLRMIECGLAQTSWFRKTREDGTNFIYQSAAGVDYCLTHDVSPELRSFYTTTCDTPEVLQSIRIAVEPSPTPPYIRQLSVDVEQKLCLDIYANTFTPMNSDCSAVSTQGTWWTLQPAL